MEMLSVHYNKYFKSDIEKLSSQESSIKKNKKFAFLKIFVKNNDKKLSEECL